ncbi:hypothetical protein F4604DRAFT_1708249 [Suillus subluteus]|nr:hypothetical protein F4604DRAFT_1708249 [Suillus subluteus]
MVYLVCFWNPTISLAALSSSNCSHIALGTCLADLIIDRQRVYTFRRTSLLCDASFDPPILQQRFMLKSTGSTLSPRMVRYLILAIRLYFLNVIQVHSTELHTSICICDALPDILVQASTTTRKKSTFSHLLKSDATRYPSAGHLDVKNVDYFCLQLTRSNPLCLASANFFTSLLARMHSLLHYPYLPVALTEGALHRLPCPVAGAFQLHPVVVRQGEAKGA